jgi:hypothetical protein
MKDTVGSLRNCFSRWSAVVTPANPPPRITSRVTFSGQEIARAAGNSGPRKFWASSRAAWHRIPSKKQDKIQQINAGKSTCISSAVHCGCCPLIYANPPFLVSGMRKAVRHGAFLDTSKARTGKTIRSESFWTTSVWSSIAWPPTSYDLEASGEDAEAGGRRRRAANPIQAMAIPAAIQPINP